MEVFFVFLALACAVKGLNITEESTRIASCTINVNTDMPNPPPLVLEPLPSLEFLTPTNARATLELEAGREIRIACPGADNAIQDLGTAQVAVLTCQPGGKFSDNIRRPYDFNRFACTSVVEATVRENPARIAAMNCNHDNEIFLEIGFQVNTDGFVPQIDICFDNLIKNTLWSRYDLVRGITGVTAKVSRLRFKPDDYYRGYTPEKNYSPTQQLVTFQAMFGATFAGNYIEIYDKSKRFLNRGHLTASSDFVYVSQQAATFHYINAAPQWKSFNEGNWAQIEQQLWAFVAVWPNNLIVYTGTEGILTLPDINGDQKEIWLAKDESGNRGIPVPKLFWKVVYDETTRKGVAIVGVNNPYTRVAKLDDLDDSYLLCKDNHRTTVSWLQLAIPNSKKRGYTYCCKVDDAFKARITSLPDLPELGHLDWGEEPSL